MKQLPRFPTMLRKMWSGQEVQSWIDKNIAPLFVQPSAEPVAWMQSEHSYDPERHGMQRRLSWKKLESDDDPLYAQPTDSAALRDAAIAELVRRKMTSGNSVPVERCIITAAEIAAIAHHQTTGESE